MKAKTYVPKPLDTTSINLDPELTELTEAMARNTHDVWAAARIKEGWTYGPKRNDTLKEHPDLLPYELLADSEKEYDRMTSISTLKFIIGCGYTISKTK